MSIFSLCKLFNSLFPGSPTYDTWARGTADFKIGSNGRLEMTSPSEANFDEAALEAELEALHMSRLVSKFCIHFFDSTDVLVQSTQLRALNPKNDRVDFLRLPRGKGRGPQNDQ